MNHNNNTKQILTCCAFDELVDWVDDIVCPRGLFEATIPSGVEIGGTFREVEGVVTLFATEGVWFHNGELIALSCSLKKFE